VRLLLNGQEVGTSAAQELKAEFEVPYAAGELRAIALSKGEPIAELAFKTAGKPAKLRLNADRKTIRRDRNDLSYVTLEVLDAAGNLVPDAVVPVTFKVEGAGALAASGSANPKDVFSFRRERPRTYHGKCLAIVRPKNVAGAITVEATAPDLAPATAVVTVG
jgi:beta-galactosidase